MDLKEIDVNTRNWVNSAQDREYWRTHVNAVLYLRVSKTIGFVNLEATHDQTVR